MAVMHYYYNEQLRKYVQQFCGIFGGLQVQTGKDETGLKTMMTVPIVVGSKDRVVASIMSRNTQNLPFSLPAMSANISNIELAPERRKGISTTDRRTYLEQGHVFPQDLQAIYRTMPIPYNLALDLVLYASNTDQMFQMLEQILLLFDPSLQIQLNDKAFDWTKITSVELTGISNEENYPSGTERRMIQWSLSFQMPIYLSVPMEVRNTVINEVKIRIGNMEGFSLNEFDDSGNLQPFRLIDEVGNPQQVPDVYAEFSTND